MYFYLSIGSNIDPEYSAVEIVRRLLGSFGCFGLFPFQFTQPEGIESENLFLNSLAVIYSTESSAEVKAKLNKIEVSLGRDRSDPLRSIKARSADLDIIKKSQNIDLAVFSSTSERYIQTCLGLKGVMPDLSNKGLPAFKRPASIDLDALSGDITVVEDEFDRFKYGIETAFVR